MTVKEILNQNPQYDESNTLIFIYDAEHRYMDHFYTWYDCAARFMNKPVLSYVCLMVQDNGKAKEIQLILNTLKEG